jgi:phenylalanyl-tRNA synthetase alpha chain
MDSKIEEIKKSFNSDIESVKDLNLLEDIRIKYLSRNGIISILFEEFKNLPKEDKPKYGQTINDLKKNVQTKYNKIKTELENKSTSDEKYIDLTLPGRRKEIGNKPLRIIRQEICRILFLSTKILYLEHIPRRFK